MNILVRNLSRKTTEEQLMKLFSPFGKIISVNIVMDDKTRQSKGFGFVEMPDSSEAKAAIQALNGKAVDGEKIRVKQTIAKK
jgi:RNA recognition motif-containing protein